MKEDYDSDSPIESYATLKRNSRPDKLDGRSRLAPIGTDWHLIKMPFLSYQGKICSD